MRLRTVGMALGLAVGIAGTNSAMAAEPAQGKLVAPTFARDVAPILQAKCQGCHRKGQVGPFALETYEQARKRAVDIANVVEERQMPPWKPAPGVGPKLKHDRSLAAAEVAVLRAWADAGAPKGEDKHLPPTPTFADADSWKLGPPDLVLEPAEDFTVPADGPDIYRCFVIPTKLLVDRYVAAVEFRPGNRRVVHHLSTYIDAKGRSQRLDDAEPGPGYTSFAGPGVDPDGELGFWNAGNEPTHLPDGIGLRLPARSSVILQVHYHPSGKPEADRTRIGLYFAKAPVKQALHWNDATNIDFRLPAGDPDIEVKASWFVPVDVEVHAVAPHMHLLGRDIRMTATLPNGKSFDLIHIPDWDPGWQSQYFFEKPITLPRGSMVKVLARYDNSGHARNPNQPPKHVRAGHSVSDEMCVGYIAVTKKGQDLTKPGQRDDLYGVFCRQRVRKIQKYLADRGF